MELASTEGADGLFLPPVSNSNQGSAARVLLTDPSKLLVPITLAQTDGTNAAADYTDGDSLSGTRGRRRRWRRGDGPGLTLIINAPPIWTDRGRQQRVSRMRSAPRSSDFSPTRWSGALWAPRAPDPAAAVSLRAVVFEICIKLFGFTERTESN